MLTLIPGLYDQGQGELSSAIYRNGEVRSRSLCEWGKGKMMTTSIFIYLLMYLLFRAATMAYGSSQARGLIRAVAAGLYHSHSNAGSDPTPQLTTKLDL